MVLQLNEPYLAKASTGSHLLHDVFDLVLLAVQDHSPLFFILQVMEERAVGLVFPLVLQVAYVYSRHLPLLLSRRVQDGLQSRQACRRMEKKLFQTN